jgi:hypothetical protein
VTHGKYNTINEDVITAAVELILILYKKWDLDNYLDPYHHSCNEHLFPDNCPLYKFHI